MPYIAPHNQQTRQLQIVARMQRHGAFRMDGKKYILWKYMTFYTGSDQPAICAEFVRIADTDKEGFLRFDALQEGEIVVTPGLIYKKIPMSGLIMAEHLRKMTRFRPKAQVVYEKDKGAAVDLGTVDLRTKH